MLFVRCHCLMLFALLHLRPECLTDLQLLDSLGFPQETLFRVPE